MSDRSDIWSLGVIMIEIVSGVHPFSGMTAAETVPNIIAGKMNGLPKDIQGDLKQMIIWMLTHDPSKRPSTEQLLESDLMQLVAKIETRNSTQISELESKVQQEKRRADLAVSEKDRLQVELNRANTEKDRLQVELNRANTEKDRGRQEKQRAQSEKDRLQVELNRANTDKDRLQVELDRERQEKERAQSEKNQEKQRANNAEELTAVFQQQVERTHSEVTRLTTENQQLKAELSRRETVPSTPKVQLKQTPVPTPKPKQSLIQITSSPQPITVNLQVPTGMSGHKKQNIFKHDNTEAYCTITSDPIISDGIVYYETVFEKHDGNWAFGIGIADSTVVFQPNNLPDEDGNNEKTVGYYSG
ncbi:MAG: hypothetical protein EZS28_041631, partial [Streblomastix strix]